MKPSETEILYRAVHKVMSERDRQQDIHGNQMHLDMLKWHVILAEEYGEFAMEVCKDSFGYGRDRTNMLTEAIQMTAVGLAIVEKLLAESDRERFAEMTGQHPDDIPIIPEDEPVDLSEVDGLGTFVRKVVGRD